MADVISLGSANVDRTRYLSRADARALEDRYDWFPEPGETVRVGGVPDRFATGATRSVVGGKGANQAVAAARAGADAALLGRVGADEGEYDLLSTLADRGVATDGVEVVGRETGKAYIVVDDGGESWIAVVGGANDAVDETYVDRHYDRVRRADVLLLQNEIPVSAVAALLRRLAGELDRPRVIFNPAPVDGAAPLLECEAIDVVVTNETEYAALESRLERADATLVRTRGKDAVVVSGEHHHRVSPPPVDPVDTTGAGDVFCGFLAARLAAGEPIDRATDVATVAASLSTTREGAQAAVPTIEAVTDFRRSLAPGRTEP